MKKQKVHGKTYNIADELHFARGDDNKLYVEFRGEKFYLSRGDDNKLYIELFGRKYDAYDFFQSESARQVLGVFDRMTKK